MTKEEQKRVSDKEFKTIRRITAKEYGWKTRDWCAYRLDVPYFFSSHIIIQRPVVGDENVGAILRVKLLELDSLFWEIFGLEENKNAPIGLRGNGAFSINGPELLRTSVQLDFSVKDKNVKQACQMVFDEMNQAVEKFKAQKWSIWNFE